MKSLYDWWYTSCEFCLQTRRIILDAAKLAISLLIIAAMFFASLFGYWLFFDNDPAIGYGPNGRAEFIDNRIIFHLDATRLRDCPTEIRRKITGCGQIDLAESFATTPVGDKAPPIAVPLATIFQSFSPQQLSGNVCSLVSQATSYCNPAQKLLRMPIITQSPPINFIPAPRAKTYTDPLP